MLKVHYLKTLDDADSIVADTHECKTLDEAIGIFNKYVQELVNEMLSNNILNCKMSIHNYRALAKVEGTQYCIILEK